MLIIAALMAYSEFFFFFFYSLGASVAKNIYCSVFSEKYKVPKKNLCKPESIHQLFPRHCDHVQ